MPVFTALELWHVTRDAHQTVSIPAISTSDAEAKARDFAQRRCLRALTAVWGVADPAPELVWTITDVADQGIALHSIDYSPPAPPSDLTLTTPGTVLAWDTDQHRWGIYEADSLIHRPLPTPQVPA